MSNNVSNEPAEQIVSIMASGSTVTMDKRDVSLRNANDVNIVERRARSNLFTQGASS